jgi:hypothetical protein
MRFLLFLTLLLPLFSHAESRVGGSYLEIVGTAKGDGTVNIGQIGVESEISIKPDSNDTAEQVAKKLVQAAARDRKNWGPGAVTAKGSLLFFYNTLAGTLYCKSTDTGIVNFETVSNLAAVYLPESKSVKLTWTAPKQAPMVIYIYRNTYLAGGEKDKSEFIDTPKHAGKYTYKIFCCYEHTFFSPLATVNIEVPKEE